MPRRSKEQVVCEFFAWNLFQRDGVYYADGRGNQLNRGKHSLGTRSHNEAMQALRELDRRTAIIQKLILPEQATVNCEDIPIDIGWEKYLSHCSRPAALGGVGPGTLKRYRAVREKNQLFCREKSLLTWKEVDRKAVEQYGAWLKAKGYSDGSIYLECTLIKQLVKWLIDEERVLPESRRIRLALYRSEESDAYCYTREQVQAMVNHCRGIPRLHWLADIITALATSGMRIGELVGLRWSDINLGVSMITLPDTRHSGRSARVGAVRTTKGRRTRRVPIHPDLQAILAGLARRADGRVFGGAGGGVLKPDKVRTALINKVIAPLKAKFPTPQGEIGFAHGRLHGFRHYFVSQAFLSGAGEGEIRDWVGHRDSRILDRYRHLRYTDSQRKMAQISFIAEVGADQIAHADGVTADNTDGDGAAANQTNDKTGSAGAPGVPEPRQGQNSSAASAPAQREESECIEE